MPKTVIKVYFNNGCTTLIYNENTTAEDIIRIVIKGRLSLNELRYKQCFQLRAARFSLPIRDFDPLFLTVRDNNNETKKLKVEEFHWLKNDFTIKEWLNEIEANEDPKNLDYWMLQLRIRYLSTDLNEVKFKDPVTFNYYYEQIKNEFTFHIASNIQNADLVLSLLDLGCLEMRRSFQNMNPNVLDKKINYEYLEKDVGLKRFFPEIVMNQKSKNIKKMIIKGLKAHENLNEMECMLKYLEKLLLLWKYNEETYNCTLGSTWGVPITVTIGYITEISCTMNNSKEPFQNAKFEKITEIFTELDSNLKNGLLKLKVSEAKEPLVFRFESLKEADNMASIIDGYCRLKSKTSESKWVKCEQISSINRHSFEKYTLNEKISISDSQEFNKSIITRTANSVHILSESDDLGTSASSIDTNCMVGSANEFLISENNSKSNDIKAESLTICEKLGSGQFGDVFRGTYKKSSTQTIEVAIKQLKINNDSIENMDADDHTIIAKKFMREAKIMEKFDHSHIIKLIGICSDGTLSIIMELAKFGQLRNYLQNNKEHIETTSLLLYCFQLSSAMAYLENKKFVHRDIAARNVLVANHESIKLADFGLSREIDDNIYLASKCKLPIKWMAPESINFRKFTSQSDVWMYGICVWEILSYGSKPFVGIKNQDVIKLIEEKKRLIQPSNCSDDLYSLLLQCWEYDFSKRPSFGSIKESLNLIYTNSKENKSPKASSLMKPIHSSLSNGSSYFSNSSSTSSSVSSSGNNINIITDQTNTQLNNSNLANDSSDANNTVTMMMMMPLGKTNKHKTESSNQVINSISTPPPKPNRMNQNFSLKDFSPKHASTINKTSYLLKKSLGNGSEITGGIGFDDDISAIILNRDDIEKCKKADLPNLHSPTYNTTKYGASSTHYESENKHEISNALSSKQNDYLWLEEKLKSMGVQQNKESSPSKSVGSNGSNNAGTSHSIASPGHHDPPNQTDLLLRDQTLAFIQKISNFIRYLNTDKHMLDNELHAIIIALNRLIEIIEGIQVNNQSKKLKTNKVNELEKCLEIMVLQLKGDNIENVINTALELARKANELFHAITKPMTVNQKVSV